SQLGRFAVLRYRKVTRMNVPVKGAYGGEPTQTATRGELEAPRDRAAGSASLTQELRLIARGPAIGGKQDFIVLALHRAARNAIRSDDTDAWARRTRPAFLTLRTRRSGRPGRTDRTRSPFGPAGPAGPCSPCGPLLQPATLANKASAITKCGTRIVIFSQRNAAPPFSSKTKLGSSAQGRPHGRRHWPPANALFNLWSAYKRV